LGLGVVVVLYEFAVLAKLVAVRTVLETLLFYLPFAILVVFSQELRRALAAFGRNPFFAWFSGYQAEETISDIVLAATTMSARRIGGLNGVRRRGGPEA